MIRIAPSVLAAGSPLSKSCLEILKEYQIEYLHFDVMDGIYVPNSQTTLAEMRRLRADTDLKFDVHLMVKDPLLWGRRAVEAGADAVTFHLETVREPVKMLKAFRALGVESGIVLRPGINAAEIPGAYIEEADVIQQMTVMPGCSGQHFIRETLSNISRLRRLIDLYHPETVLEADGDITVRNLYTVMSAGADVIVSGKGIFEGDLLENIRALTMTVDDFEKKCAKLHGKEAEYEVCNRN